MNSEKIGTIVSGTFRKIWLARSFFLALLFVLGTPSITFALDEKDMIQIESYLQEESEAEQSGKSGQAKSIRNKTIKKLAAVFPCNRKIKTPGNCHFFKQQTDSNSLQMRCNQSPSDPSEQRSFEKLMFSVTKEKSSKKALSAYEDINDSSANYTGTFEPICFRKKSFFHQGEFIDVSIKLHHLQLVK